MNAHITELKKLAESVGKRLKYNRSTGQYQVGSGFVWGEGETASRNEKGRLCLTQNQINRLLKQCSEK